MQQLKIWIGLLSFLVTFCVYAKTDRAFCQIKTDHHGNAIAIWQDLEDSFFVIRASSCPAGGEWSPHSTIISQATKLDCLYPQVALNDAGTVVAIWQEGSGSESRINGAGMLWDHRDEWSLFPAPLSPPAEVCVLPQVGIDQDGNCVAVWENVTAQQIQASMTASGTPWSCPPINIGASHDSVSISPALAVNPNGIIAIAWEDMELRAQQSLIHVRFGSTTGAWQEAQTLSTLNHFAYAPSIALNETGSALIAWQSDSGEENSELLIQAIHYPEETVPYTFPKNTGNMTGAQVGLNENNLGILVWTEKDETTNSLLIRSSLGTWDGTTMNWAEIQTPSATTGNFINPSVGLNDQNLLIAVWEIDTPSTNFIQSAVYSLDAPLQWLAPTILGNDTGGTQPRIALSNTSHATVIWATDEIDPALGCALYTTPSGWGNSTGIPE